MTRQILDPEAVYRVAVQQLKDEGCGVRSTSWDLAVKPSVSGGFTPYGNPLSGLFATDEPAPLLRSESWATAFARPSASQPPAQGR